MNLLLETRPDNYPFSHFTCPKVFEDVYYRDLLEELPTLSHYSPLPHADAMQNGDSTRYSLQLNNSSLAKLGSKRLTNLYKYLISDELKWKIYGFLEKDLSSLYKKVKIKRMPGTPVPVFYYDKTSYYISPHTDAHKVVTTQFYLPHDDQIEHAGTCFLNNKSEIVKKLKFLPNTGYGFAVSKKSWHMVERLEELAYPRVSLMLIYYTEQGLAKISSYGQKY